MVVGGLIVLRVVGGSKYGKFLDFLLPKSKLDRIDRLNRRSRRSQEYMERHYSGPSELDDYNKHYEKPHSAAAYDEGLGDRSMRYPGVPADFNPEDYRPK
jgi:hypothetical protein